MKPIAWAITGAGHFLDEVFTAMLEIAEEIEVTSFVSSAAEEVLRTYGFQDLLKEISKGTHYSEVFTDNSEGASAIHAGRLARGVYSALVVAPATANTVAKVCNGIADTLVTNAIAQALKGGVLVYILPTDQSKSTVSTLPVRVEPELCIGCRPCLAEEACENGAFTVREGRGIIDYLRCVGCGSCLESCTHSAVKRGEKIKVTAREVDLENVERLRRTRGITVLRDPDELMVILQNHVTNES